jgi:hypothetical protein
LITTKVTVDLSADCALVIEPIPSHQTLLGLLPFSYPSSSFTSVNAIISVIADPLLPGETKLVVLFEVVLLFDEATVLDAVVVKVGLPEAFVVPEVPFLFVLRFFFGAETNPFLPDMIYGTLL